MFSLILECYGDLWDFLSDGLLEMNRNLEVSGCDCGVFMRPQIRFSIVKFV